MIIEATVVNTREENWQAWEPILIKANYHKVWFGGLSNFYLREEDIELRYAFRLTPSVFDGFETAELASLKQMLAELESQIKTLFSRRQRSLVQQDRRLARVKRLAEWSNVHHWTKAARAHVRIANDLRIAEIIPETQMAAFNEMIVATSIPARISRRIRGVEFGPAWQTACINSWRAEGFHVVSLNAKEEVAALEPFTSRVEIVELPLGRHRPRIVDFLDVIAKSSCEVAGIVNADCLLIPGTRLAKHLTRNVDGFVMAERLNFSQLAMLPTGRHCFGFDAFFCNPKILAGAERDDRWIIGDTWWDYWLPLSLHLAGVKLKTLPAPVMAHFDHQQGWDAQAWVDNGRYFVTFLRGRAEDLRDPYLASAMRAQPDTVTDVQLLSFKIFHWLRSRERLWDPEEGSLSACRCLRRRRSDLELPVTAPQVMVINPYCVIRAGGERPPHLPELCCL